MKKNVKELEIEEAEEIIGAEEEKKSLVESINDYVENINRLIKSSRTPEEAAKLDAEILELKTQYSAAQAAAQVAREKLEAKQEEKEDGKKEVREAKKAFSGFLNAVPLAEITGSDMVALGQTYKINPDFKGIHPLAPYGALVGIRYIASRK